MIRASGYILFIAVIYGFAAGSAFAGGLNSQVAGLEKDYRAQMKFGRANEQLAVTLGTAGETWRLAAVHVSRRLKTERATAWLKQAQADYHLRMSESPDPMTAQLAGLNLMYQSLDAMALILARHYKDQDAVKMINETEKATLKAAARQGWEGQALAAISGGVMTMLAVTAGQVDRKGTMAAVLAGEYERRRTVDDNIAALTNVEPARRILLMTNNHLHGSLSMIQIIGLVRRPSLKGKLGAIERKLIKVKDKDLAEQVMGGAKAVVDAGFLVAPTFGTFKP